MASELVVVGASVGGLLALNILLASLPGDFSFPLAIAQHRNADSDGMLRAVLQRHSALMVIEPDDKETIVPGRVYLAPADYHLLVEGGRFALSTEGRVWHARPSIDVLFESAADSYAERTIGVILTGAGRDGARGAARIKERGGLIVVQEPATAEGRSLPEATIRACAVDRILPLSQIGPLLAGLCPPASG
jgi:two-component system chemotaxis response regulator CheB